MTQTDVKMAWGRVGDQLSALGLKLKLHAEQEFSEDSDETDEDGGISEAVERLSEAIDNVVDTVGNVVTDKAVQHDVREAGRRLIDAVGTTLDQATSQLDRKR